MSCNELCPDENESVCLSRYETSFCVDYSIYQEINCTGRWREELTDDTHPDGVCVYEHLNNQQCSLRGFTYQVWLLMPAFLCAIRPESFLFASLVLSSRLMNAKLVVKETAVVPSIKDCFNATLKSHGESVRMKENARTKLDFPSVLSILFINSTKLNRVAIVKTLTTTLYSMTTLHFYLLLSVSVCTTLVILTNNPSLIASMLPINLLV